MKTTTTAESLASQAGSKHHSGQGAPVPKQAGQPPAEGPHSTKRILLVDDDPTVRDSLHDLLAGEGYVVVPAGDGQAALDLVHKSAVDLVLLDLNMPGRNGWDTFEQLSREHPLLPIIIITARPNQLFSAVNAGVGALLEKPMDIEVLLQTMTSLLAEPAEKRLARLAGKETEFHYRPARADQGGIRPTQHR